MIQKTRNNYSHVVINHKKKAEMKLKALQSRKNGANEVKILGLYLKNKNVYLGLWCSLVVCRDRAVR